jgi:manganese transport protein
MNTQHKLSSLSEVNASIDTTTKKGFWKKLFAFAGPAYLVSVGYMDPGNWATDLAGGSQFGYALIWVLLMSNLIALLLQSLSARLGIVRGLDLAQASRETYHPVVNLFLYIFAEIAIAACDLAEVLGMAIGLQLLFGLPLAAGVAITVLDTFLLLALQSYGMRRMEVFILSLVLIIGIAFGIEMVLAKPVLADVALGFIPSMPNNAALYIAIGIIGATVMPHNLYLHSSLVQTRKIDRSEKGLRTAIRFNIFDSTIALNFAFFVNAAILILAASTFHTIGMYGVAEIKDAHHLLAPLLGSKWAPILFAVALIAAGQSSTITGTLAGQIVMEGYLNLRIQPWLRRIITRVLAIAPALLTILLLGESATGKLLILSQVILSLQLGFAVIPLIHFVSNKKTMGVFAISKKTQFFAWLSAAIIVVLNAKLVAEQLIDWINTAQHPLVIWLTAVPAALLAAILLMYIIISPLLQKLYTPKSLTPHKSTINQIPVFTQPSYKKIAITVDFSTTDNEALKHAVAQGGTNAEYLLIHIVETAGALLLGNEISDLETTNDTESMALYASQMILKGYKVETRLGYGSPKKAIPKIVKDYNADILVMGAHGHRMLKDIIFGTTIDTVRHNVTVPVMIVRA